MFMFIVAVVLAFAAGVAIVWGKYTWTASDGYNPRTGAYDKTTQSFNLRLYVGLPLFGLAALCALLTCLYKQDPGDVVVVKGAGGNIVRVDDTPGMGFKMPWQSATGFDITNQKVEMFSNDGGDGDDGAAISSPVEEGTNVDVSITVGFSQRSECVREIVRNYRNENGMRERALRPGVRSEVRKATARYSAFNIKQSRGELETDIATALNERWQDDICAEVESIDLGNLTLDSTTEDALSRVTEQQAAVEEARADFQAAEVRAETVKVNAQASADADQITRCGATTTTETREVAGKDTEVEVVVPVPIDRCRNLLNEQVILQNYIEALRKIGEQGNLVVVDSDVRSILDLGPQG